MALILKTIFNAYWNFLDNADPRTSELFLVRSPLTILGLVGVYLTFVNHVGRNLMENRKPYKLKNIIILYNLLQIALCSYVVIKGFYYIRTFNILCTGMSYDDVSPESLELIKILWLYFFTKVIDLLDTVFFILRKKDNQVTFLHVYHHAGMVIMCWLGINFVAGGHSIYLPYINSFVHIVMYVYYLLTTYDDNFKKNIWWKRHITELQLVQFLILFIIYTTNMFQTDCSYSKKFMMTFITQSFVMVSLFGDFYYRTYIQKKNPKSTIKSDTSTTLKICTTTG